MSAALVIASNRGPISFTRTPDGFASSRGSGGLVTAVTAALQDEPAIWVAAALSDDDRARAQAGEPIVGEPSPRVEVRLLTLDPEMLAGYYEEASNRTLWFVAHGATPRVAGEHAWASYRRANEAFAQAIDDAAEDGATVLVQDYHLCLVPSLLRERRPDLSIAFFWHIPFPEPEIWRRLGEPLARELLEGMDSADAVGFHARRWSSRYESCRRALGVEERAVVATVPLGVDPNSFVEIARTPDVDARVAELTAFDGRTLVVRADRIDPAKGIPDGLRAYDELLGRRPDLHDRVVHLVRLTPSREGIPEYDEERRTIETLAAEINARHGRNGWAPVELVVADDFAGSLAAYRRYDVLLVTSRADGMNLVAREGPIVNERDGVLVLSQGAGAADTYADGGALLVEPGDVATIGDALEAAIDLDPEARRGLAAEARARAAGTPPAEWLAEQRRLARAAAGARA